MIVQYSNVHHRSDSAVLTASAIALSSVVIIIPVFLIILGAIVSSQNSLLLSPSAKDSVISNATENLPLLSPQSSNSTQIASPNPTDFEPKETSVNQSSNSQDKTITVPANESEILVEDQDILSTSQIIIKPSSSKNTFYVSSKSTGQFTLKITPQTTSELSVDYTIINP